MSIRKISNKSLSRNLKIRKAPLRVLPLATINSRHRVKQKIKKQMMEEYESQSFPPSTVQYKLQKAIRSTGESIKKTAIKGPLTIKPLISYHFKMNALRWILVLIFVYLAAGTAIVMIQDGTESLKNIVIYSIIGFFTFFMGYLGWILARDVLMIVFGKKHAQNKLEIET